MKHLVNINKFSLTEGVVSNRDRIFHKEKKSELFFFYDFLKKDLNIINNLINNKYDLNLNFKLIYTRNSNGYSHYIFNIFSDVIDINDPLLKKLFKDDRSNTTVYELLNKKYKPTDTIRLSFKCQKSPSSNPTYRSSTTPYKLDFFPIIIYNMSKSNEEYISLKEIYKVPTESKSFRPTFSYLLKKEYIDVVKDDVVNLSNIYYDKELISVMRLSKSGKIEWNWEIY